MNKLLPIGAIWVLSAFVAQSSELHGRLDIPPLSVPLDLTPHRSTYVNTTGAPIHITKIESIAYSLFPGFTGNFYIAVTCDKEYLFEKFVQFDNRDVDLDWDFGPDWMTLNPGESITLTMEGYGPQGGALPGALLRGLCFFWYF